MDWNFAIEKHKESLKHVLAMLVAMAALPEGGTTLPRRLHRAILRLLRPAEAATRRLIIIVARGLVLPPPSFKHKPKPRSLIEAHTGTGIVDTGISICQLGLANVAPPIRKPRGRALDLPLTDTLPGLPRRRHVVAASVPRISGAGSAALVAAPPRRRLSANDLLDVTTLHRRLAILARALDDLSGQAKRLARWRARRDRAIMCGAFHRRSMMRPGRPPGWRKPGSRGAYDVHQVLDDLHGLAFWAEEPKHDTS
jgi:hypothetical protein